MARLESLKKSDLALALSAPVALLAGIAVAMLACQGFQDSAMQRVAESALDGGPR